MLYFAGIRFSQFEQKREIKYTLIFGIAHHRKFISVEYQQFCDVMCSILRNINSIMIGILIVKIPKIKMERIFYVRKSRN